MLCSCYCNVTLSAPVRQSLYEAVTSIAMFSMVGEETCVATQMPHGTGTPVIAHPAMFSMVMHAARLEHNGLEAQTVGAASAYLAVDSSTADAQVLTLYAVMNS
jgi:hypothetical protein